MSYQTIFKRYELKYLMTLQQKEKVLQAMEPYMSLDHYGRTTIRNIYYDTDTFRLVRNSMEHPVYKEKLRVRSYGFADRNDPVFIELKKKYQSIVYKRRLALPQYSASGWLCGQEEIPLHTQIAAEIEYFCKYYQTLQPTVFLSYEREAFYSRCGDDFRVTFDENILSREEELTLNSDVWGQPLLPRGQVLMEIKTGGGIPLWMSHFLTKHKIFKTSYSKYGTAYQTMMIPNQEGGKLYA